MSERPQNKNLKRGGSPGRPKGVPNKRTLEIHEFARSVLEDPTYRAKLTQRIIAGKAVAIEQLLYAYAWGRPLERIQIIGPVLSEVTRLAALYNVTPEEIIIEAEAIAAGRDT